MNGMEWNRAEQNRIAQITRSQEKCDKNCLTQWLSNVIRDQVPSVIHSFGIISRLVSSSFLNMLHTFAYLLCPTREKYWFSIFF